MKIYKKIFVLFFATLLSCSTAISGWAKEAVSNTATDIGVSKDYDYYLKYGTPDLLMAPDTQELRNLFSKNIEGREDRRASISIKTFDIPANIDEPDIIQDDIAADDISALKDVLDLYADQSDIKATDNNGTADNSKATVDNRVRVNGAITPFNGICLLQCWYSNGGRKYGTGFLVNGTHVVTAAHCILDPVLGYVTNIDVIPGGSDLNSSVSGSYAVSAVIPTEYINTRVDGVGDVGVDIGILTLAKSYSSLYQYTYRNESNTVIENGTYFICGFPEDTVLGTMWADFKGKILGTGSTNYGSYVALQNYTIVGGNSGGPLTNYDTIRVNGVLSRKIGPYDYATKIDADLAYFIIMNT